MEWMWAAFWAWLGWNVLAPVLACLALLIIVGLLQVPRLVRQSRCSHPRLHQAGTAGTQQHCSECGKFVCYTWDLQKHLAAK